MIHRRETRKMGDWTHRRDVREIVDVIGLRDHKHDRHDRHDRLRSKGINSGVLLKKRDRQQKIAKRQESAPQLVVACHNLT